jgi:hypothetical protein
LILPTFGGQAEKEHADGQGPPIGGGPAVHIVEGKEFPLADADIVNFAAVNFAA